MRMKIITMVFIVIAVFFMVPSQLLAQAPDTVYISANPPGPNQTGPTIEQFISGDTTGSGARNNPNRVYVLQQTGSLDTVYYYSDPIYLTTATNLTIIGKVNPTTGRPPVIQPWIRADNSAPANFVITSARGNVITFKNLYFLGLRYDGIQATANLININADSTTIKFDHCIIDNASGTAANFSGSANWNKFYMTNCEFRNVSNQFWQSGVAMWANNGVPMDTVIIRNNTFFGMGRAVYGGPGYYRYLVLDHNTCFLGASGLLLSTRQTNATITNNIFYGVIAHGADSSYIKAANANAAKQGFGVVMMDSLATVGSTYNITEADRNVVVENNAYFWPQAMVDKWNQINDTATGWRVVPPKWMNEATEAMFNDHGNWPGFIQANNVNVDPGFSQTITGPAVDSLLKFVVLVGWSTPWGSIGNAGNYRFWQLKTNPDPAHVFDQMPNTWNNWTNGYPVPEDLRYSNSALQSAGTDGKALGDLNWFPEQITAVKQAGNSVPAKFDLRQNYPNPFNPSTEIRYSLSQNGFVSLKVYTLLGQEITTLVSGLQKAGEHVAIFNAGNLASGIYFYTLKSGSVSITKKMVLMK